MALDAGKAQMSSFSWKAFTPKRKRNPARPRTADNTLTILRNPSLTSTFLQSRDTEEYGSSRPTVMPRPSFSSPLPPKAQRLLGETGPFPTSIPTAFASASKTSYLPEKTPYVATSHAMGPHEGEMFTSQQPRRISAASRQGSVPRRLSQSRDSIVHYLSRTDSCPELVKSFQAAPTSHTGVLAGELDTLEGAPMSAPANKIEDLRVQKTFGHMSQQCSSRRLGCTFSSAEQIAIGHLFGTAVNSYDDEEDVSLEDAMASYYVDDDVYPGIVSDTDFGASASSCMTYSPPLVALPPMICITDSDSCPVTPTTNDCPEHVDYVDYKGDTVSLDSAQLCLGSILDLFPSLPSSAVMP